MTRRIFLKKWKAMPEAGTEHFRCPLCAQHAPIERLEEGPYSLEMFYKTLGGKRKLTDAERALRKGHGYRPGSAPGLLEYEPIGVSEEVQGQVVARVAELNRNLVVSESEGEREPRPPSAPAPPQDLKAKISDAHGRLSGWAKPNGPRAESALDDLEEEGADVGDARSALEGYTELVRGDFSDAEEYSGARSDAWQEFLDALGDTEGEES